MNWLAPMLLLLLVARFATATHYPATKSRDWGDPSVWRPSGALHMSICSTCNAAILVVLLLVGAAFGQATYTSAGSGNWTTAATWTHTGTPCSATVNYPVYNGDPASSSTACGDIVIIQTGHTITCPANSTCTVGNSPTTNTAVLTANGTGSLTLGTGATFIYAGRVRFTTGTVTVGAGSKIQYDSSYASSNATTVNYTFDCTVASCSASAFLWAINGTSSQHVTIEGDSFYSPYNKVATCSAANQCLAGAFNHDGGSTFSTNNQGQGTISYLDIKDVYGSPMNGHGNTAWMTSIKSGSNSTFTAVTVTNSGTFGVNESNGATVGLTINGLAVTASIYTQPPASGLGTTEEGCFDMREQSTTAAVFLLSNAYFDCVIDYYALNGSNGIWTWRNVLTYRNQSGVNPGHYVGITNSSNQGPSDTFDEYYFYGSTAYSGGTQDLVRPTTPVFSLINSVFFSPKTSVTGTHLNSLTTSVNYLPASGNMLIKNNVTGVAGVNTKVGTLLQLTTSFSYLANALPRNLNLTVTGNVGMCDQWGYSGFAPFFTRWNGVVGTHTLTELIENNTNCAAIIGGLASIGVGDNSGQEGAMGFEGAPQVGNLAETADSNLHYNLLNLAIPEVCGANSTNFSPPNPVSIVALQNNAVVGTNTGGPPICNNGSAGNPSTWVPAGMPRNDIIIQNRLPVMVDSRRSVFTFDGDYLVPSGVLGGVVGQSASTYWSAQSGWQGSWSGSSHFYTVGQIVSDQQTGGWGGKTTFWRCIQTHTSSSINRPSTGVDPSNIYLDFNAYWEPAYMQFFRQQVFAGTVFYEGAVPQLTDINGNPEPMHVIGLLNAWLRQGHITMEPTLWRGCVNNASAASECGQSIPVVRHMPPPALTL